ncbi:hypothetical protein [Alteromonas lipolytica]|uniref:Uncharacterized protein n=1 Tax=Alteromonas lipolytica TaxID=1856405 RepID=A0A1E8FAP6_9ALTE|nr:hypothetical protein [Alteromonas lipolytica]OFI32979.1 hypothetical protein BFC17_01520 [Alteromonas lipolytica]GGF63631.1 hypothetical protein GCM10011338_15030 [Alteromonas lipolytica]
MFYPFSLPPMAWQLPLSGDVKDISPMTNWFSPQYEINIAGNAALEKQVITKVASYGKQLGKLTSAVLELADGEPGEAVEALRTLAKDIEALKNKTLLESVEADLFRLKNQDLAAYNALLKRLV